MGTAKRERQKQGRQARVEAARVAQAQAQRRKTFRNFGAIVVAVLVALVLLSRFTGDSKSSDVSTSSGGVTTTLAPGTTAAGAAVTVPPAGASITGATPCPAADGSSARTTTFEQAPPTCITAGKTYTAQVATTKGSFTIALDAAAAPATVNNFVVLARYHYYDGVAFHRVIPGFMMQGGDATGPTPGAGGPGYKFADELPKGSAPYYQLGSVAMANSGPNTNGSQFFVVTGDSGVNLPASYSLFGKVTAGYDDVVKSIEAVGSSSGTPSEVVTITSVTITES